MSANAPRIRHYVHGDAHESKPDAFHCAQCDLLAPREHFDQPSHVSVRAERYTASLDKWRKLEKRVAKKIYRPRDAENAVAADATADIAAAKASRSAFYRWLLRQTERNDPIGDLASDVKGDRRFPISLREIDGLRSYLHHRHAAPEALVALDEAWAEFKSKGKIRVGLSLKQRFRIFKRDQYRCQLCGKSAQDDTRLEVDHKVPVVKGGSNDPENLWTLCVDCNQGKRDEDL